MTEVSRAGVSGGGALSAGHLVRESRPRRPDTMVPGARTSAATTRGLPASFLSSIS